MKKTCFLLFLILLLPISSLHSKAVTKGSFLVVKGEIKVVRGKNESVAPKVGTTVYPGDTIISASNARAKIMMEDRNVIHISPNTEVKIETYINDGQQKNVELSLKEGKVRNEVKQVYDGEQNKFLIKTPTAVAGVRGTNFITSFDTASNQTKIITFSGKVELTNIPSAPGVQPTTVIVSKGETAESSSTQAPGSPKVMAPEELKKQDSDSKVSDKDPGSSSQNQPASGTPKKEEKTDKKKQEAGSSSSASRIVDTQDQSIKTFDKLPDGQGTPGSTAIGTPPPVFQPPPPPVNNLSGDAIRQQNDKTKVKIVPRPN